MNVVIFQPFNFVILVMIFTVGFIWRMLGGRVSYFISYLCVALTSAAYAFAIELAHGFSASSRGAPLQEYVPALLPLVAWPVMAYFLRHTFNRHPVLLFLTGLVPFLVIGAWVLIEG